MDQNSSRKIKIKLTKKVIDKIDQPEEGQIFLRDLELPGFGFTSLPVHFKHFRISFFETFCDPGAHGSLAVTTMRKGLNRISIDKNVARNVLDRHLK